MFRHLNQPIAHRSSALALSALPGLGVAHASPAKITAQSIVVNPLPDGWTTDVVTFQVGGQPLGTATGTVTATLQKPAPRPGEKRDSSLDQAMVDAYVRLKGEDSLGRATTSAAAWGDGPWQKFAGVGAYSDAVLLHANGSSRSYAVHGRVLSRYLTLAKAENGATRPPARLGWAAGDEKVIPQNPMGTSGLYGFFQNGALYGTEKYGVDWLQGAVLKTYQNLGGSGSFLGSPRVTSTRSGARGPQTSRAAPSAA